MTATSLRTMIAAPVPLAAYRTGALSQAEHCDRCTNTLLSFRPDRLSLCRCACHVTGTCLKCLGMQDGCECGGAA